MTENKLNPINIISPHYDHTRSGEGYGGDCSDFMLTTYDESGDPISLQGILSELPSFSMNITLNNGPGETVAEKTSKYFAGDLMNIINAIGAVKSNDGSTGFKNLVATDALTKRIYDGVDYSGLDLKFKIYNSFKPAMTPAVDWISNLTKYATITSNNNVTASNLVSNINAAGDTAYTCGEQIALLNVKKEHSERNKKDQYNNDKKYIDDNLTKVNEALSQIVSALRADSSPYKNKIDSIKIVRHQEPNILPWGSHSVEFCLHIVLSENTDTGFTHMSFNGGMVYGLQSDGTLNNNEFDDDSSVFDYETNPDEDAYENGVTNNFSMFFGSATDNCIIKCLEKYFNVSLKKSNKNDQYDRQDMVKANDGINAAFNDLFNIFSNADDTDIIRKAFRDSELIKFVKEAGEEAVRRYGPDRVARTFNKQNELGAKLWNLRIFPWLFKTSIPVYIKSWSYKPSKEYNVSMEFNISCYFDQVYSRDMWKFYFTGIPDKT